LDLEHVSLDCRKIARVDTACNINSARPFLISTDRVTLYQTPEGVREQWPTACTPVHHARRKGQCGTNS